MPQDNISRPPLQPLPKLVRLRDYADVMKVEDRLLVGTTHIESLEDNFQTELDRASKAVFGIEYRDTLWPGRKKNRAPDIQGQARQEAHRLAHQLKYEWRDADYFETAQLCKPYNLDMYDPRGMPMKCSALFKRQAEAVLRGYMGKVPEPIVNTEALEAKLAREAAEHKRKRQRRSD